MAALLEVREVCKRFGTVEALKHVDLTLEKGEVLGVVGDNGAGKSTLMKVISGAHAPDSGELRLAGAPVSFSSPRAARQAGLSS